LIKKNIIADKKNLMERQTKRSKLLQL